MARPPLPRSGSARALRSAPELRAAGRLGRTQARASAGPPGQDALLLLRPAVRHPAQGARQPGGRLRAVGGVPVQPRHALPEGREALPAERASRPAADAAGAHRRRLPRGGLGRGARLHRARGCARSRSSYGKDAVAVYGGASLTTEKSYLLGQVRARGAGHAAHRLQRPPLHGLGRHRLQAGVRRRPLRRIPGATSRRRRSCSSPARTSPSARRSPPTTSGAAATRGGKLIVVDPRMTPITRNADLYLPVRPGTDLALLMGMLHVMLRDGLEDREFIAAHTTGFDEVAESVEGLGPATARPRSPECRPTPSRRRRAGSREAERAMALHARGIEHHSKGVENCPRGDQPLPGHRQHRPRGRGLHHDHRPGQRPGRARARPEVRPAPGPALHHRSGGARARRARLGHRAGGDPAGRATRRVEIMEAIHRGEIKAPALDLLQPAGLAARRRLHARGAGEARVLRRHRLLPVGDRAARRRRARGQPAGGGRRRRLPAPKAGCIHIQQGREPAGRCARRTARIICDLARRLGKGKYFPYRVAAGDLRRAARGLARRRRRLLRHHLREDRPASWASSGPARRSTIPGTPRLFEGGRFFHPDGKARFVSRPSGGRAGDPVDAEFPIFLTTGRVVSQYLSGTQTRRIGAAGRPVSRAARRDPSAAGGDATASPTATGSPSPPAAARSRCRRWWCAPSGPDTVFIPYHWPGARSANRLTHRTLDPRSKIPEYKVSACRLRKADGPPDWAAGADAGRAARPGACTCRWRPDERLRVLRRSLALHRLPGLRQRLRRVRHPPRQSDDPRRLHRPPATRIATVPVVCMHCDDPTCAQVCPADAIKKTEDGVVQSSLEAALHRLLQLRAGLSVRRPEGA